MSTDLVPAIDPAPIPGPPWLFHVLWVVTFVVHLLCVNAVLGGSLLAAFIGEKRAGGRQARELLVGVNSWAISFAITFGIAPLLFVQVLLGRFFYSATILIAWAWLGMLLLLLVGYYLNYVAKFRLRDGRAVGAILWVEAACFTAIAAIQVSVSLLHMQPERWAAVADIPWRVLADPTFVPRLLHFILAALSVAGVLVAWVAVRRAARGGDRDSCDAMARYSLRVTMGATVLQLVDGFWLLMALPEGVLRSFMRGGAAALLPLTLGIVVGVLLLVVLAQIHRPLEQATRVRRVAELLVGVVVLMVLTRHHLRDVYLAAARSGERLAVAPQWGVFAIFLVLFVAGAAVTVWAMVRAASDRPGPGERAA